MYTNRYLHGLKLDILLPFTVFEGDLVMQHLEKFRHCLGVRSD
jgi:hypothetical protein